MNIWKLGPIKTAHDLRDRFLVRLLWCFVAFAIVLIPSLYVHTHPLSLFVGLAGMLVLTSATDVYLLKHPNVTFHRIQSGVLMIIVVLAAICVVVEFVLPALK